MVSVVGTVLSYTVAVLLYHPRNTWFRAWPVDYLGSVSWVVSVTGFLVGVVAPDPARVGASGRSWLIAWAGRVSWVVIPR
jgi:hypothetical protein